MPKRFIDQIRFSEQVARGLARASEETGIPITFGVITAETKEQALDRSGGKHGNLGTEAAVAALETADVLRGIGEL